MKHIPVEACTPLDFCIVTRAERKLDVSLIRFKIISAILNVLSKVFSLKMKKYIFYYY